jgi:hypothetical protein
MPLKDFKRCYHFVMDKKRNNKPGKHTQHIGLTVEVDLVAKIDHLAHRDCLSRATWMREALISAWKRAEEFKRTPPHGYLTTPIELTTPASKGKRKLLKNNNMGGGGGINDPPYPEKTG